MELKSDRTIRRNYGSQSFNRTFMELKWSINDKKMTSAKRSFNRTFMELKFYKDESEGYQGAF